MHHKIKEATGMHAHTETETYMLDPFVFIYLQHLNCALLRDGEENKFMCV